MEIGIGVFVASRPVTKCDIKISVFENVMFIQNKNYCDSSFLGNIDKILVHMASIRQASSYSINDLASFISCSTSFLKCTFSLITVNEFVSAPNKYIQSVHKAHTQLIDWSFLLIRICTPVSCDTYQVYLLEIQMQSCVYAHCLFLPWTSEGENCKQNIKFHQLVQRVEKA